MTQSTDDAPQGVKQDDSQGKPGDDVVPKKQFLAALKSATEGKEAAEREAAALRTRLAELDSRKPQQKPPTLSELRQFVEKGELSQEQADAIWEKQIVDQAVAKARVASEQVIGTAEHQRKVEAQLAGYRELKSEAWDEGTPERAKVAEEYAHLIGLGYPQGRETEAAALRAAFGDLSTLRDSQSVRTGPSDTHREVGGGRPTGGGKSDPLKSLSPDQKRYYEKGIESGRYKGWDDVKEELKYARPKH